MADEGLDSDKSRARVLIIPKPAKRPMRSRTAVNPIPAYEARDAELFYDGLLSFIQSFEEPNVAIADFSQLCEAFCETAGVPAPTLEADAHGVIAFTAVLNDVSVSVAHAPETHRDCAFVLVEFGAPPAGREQESMASLMEANFLMLGEYSPVFSRNPANGEIVLQYAYPFANASALELYQSVVEMTELALRWRADQFLDSPPQTSESPASHLSSADFA
jgi:hypothetical protein